MLLTSGTKEPISQLWYTKTSERPFKEVSMSVLPRLHGEQGFLVCSNPVPVLDIDTSPFSLQLCLAGPRLLRLNLSSLGLAKYCNFALNRVLTA